MMDPCRQADNAKGVQDTSKELKVLLIIEQCNPDWPSVPLVAYRLLDEIRQSANVTLVTHSRNRSALEPVKGDIEIIYVSESIFWSKYHDVVGWFTYRKRVIWQLYLLLTYPIYAQFNHRVYQLFKSRIALGEFDVVHAITPMMPRYPVMTSKACIDVPFIIGPVNGGVPYPKGFREVARKEFANLNFFRAIGRALIPGYADTYRNAAHIFSGSTYTLELLKKLFDLPENKLSLLYENGVVAPISESQYARSTSYDGLGNPIELLFVGRLVPYKCADIVVSAISLLPDNLRNHVHLTIVGDGDQKIVLENSVKSLGLDNKITFAGWLKQEDIYDFYQKSDVFCFPSIREFGGAVVMEAMACGLPCIVADNGGIGEYVTDETGFRIEPISRSFMIREMATKIEELMLNPALMKRMSNASIVRAKSFTWSSKGDQIMSIYQSSILNSKTNSGMSSSSKLSPK